MRKIFILFIALSFIQFANAQEDAVGGFSEGNIFVEGGIMYNSEKQGNETVSGFGIAPVVGYFFTDNVAAGLGVAYESSKVSTGGNSVSADIFGFSAFGRYYFTPASRFSIFGELNVGYATADAGPIKVNTLAVGLKPAVSFFLNENFLISGKLGGLEYSSTKADVSGAEATTNFGFELLLGKMEFGIAYKF
ncbi:MAG TPA: porin family protein [Flavobacteriaceae bacterium]|nr:porin family protein [Flavobacteriaceae bacterium]